jgi:hypothetical protein
VIARPDRQVAFVDDGRVTSRIREAQVSRFEHGLGRSTVRRPLARGRNPAVASGGLHLLDANGGQPS